ncbi:MAG: hypothetical protein IPN86_04545 [Saprospiraceae bacterium]|nr:hypothetical protein [Saprospiraceae bacterium]
MSRFRCTFQKYFNDNTERGHTYNIALGKITVATGPMVGGPGVESANTTLTMKDF